MDNQSVKGRGEIRRPEGGRISPKNIMPAPSPLALLLQLADDASAISRITITM